jgi:penicillin-binding protein 2
LLIEKVITTLISSKIKGTTIDPKFKEKASNDNRQKYFKPMIKGLFDVYNLGTASTLRVEGIDIAGKQVLRKILPSGGKRVQLKDHSIFCSICT